MSGAAICGAGRVEGKRRGVREVVHGSLEMKWLTSVRLSLFLCL